MEWKGWVHRTRLCATALAGLLLLTGSPSPARAQQVPATSDPAAFARPAVPVVEGWHRLHDALDRRANPHP